MKTERKREGAKEGKRDVANKRARRLSIALSLLLSIALSLLLPFINKVSAHKYHFSFTQIEYNAKEKAAEITLRVFADDLEAIISKRSGKPIKLDHKEAAPLVAAYVRETLELKGRDGRSQKLTWIGMESKIDVALLYLEAKAPAGLSGVQLRQRMFFDLFDDQINQVLVKAGHNKASLDFKPGESFKTIAFMSK